VPARSSELNLEMATAIGLNCESNPANRTKGLPVMQGGPLRAGAHDQADGDA
jgi:hypothetical protein